MFASMSASLFVTACLMVKLIGADSPYTVPEPTVEVASKGFRVSIPDEPGVELFAFHGNINRDMSGLEAGQFSKDVLKKCGDRWVFEDASAAMRIGDKLYFWLYVIRNKLGYRYDDGHYIVKEIKNLDPLDCAPPTVSAMTQAPPVWLPSNPDCDVPNPIFDVRIGTTGDERRKRDYSSECCELYLNVSYRMVSVAERNHRLAEENRILYELASKEANTLKLYGPLPDGYYPSPKDFVRRLIRDKLSSLLDEEITVVDAVRVPNGDAISFTVGKLKDKIAIIMAAKRGLEGSYYRLEW